MTAISWNEAAARAARFADDWAGETYEKGESQSFWTEFLAIFGVDRRRAGGYFEYAVKLQGNRTGFIDMVLPGRLLVEQKSAGRDLRAAASQALAYLDGLADHDLPQGILVSDFRSFQYKDLTTQQVTEFALAELPRHVRLFGMLTGQASVSVEEQSPVNRQAAERMAALHNRLSEAGYKGHKLELLLVRLVFCLFADDSRIFSPKQFERFIRSRTQPDGTDLGPRMAKLFEILATPHEDRPTNLDEDLAEFPYVNGGLFREPIGIPDFDPTLRLALIQACAPDWSKVSPAIFGAMFQGVMDDEARHDLGAHYTSEENILRVIKPLFLDELYEDFARAKGRPRELSALHERIANLTFLDPACGCGNFLVVAYRELRRLEHRIVESLLKNSTLVDVRDLLKVQVEQFHGIEVEDFPHLIAKTAMWLTDHQMNLEASERLGTHFTRLPLAEGANIVNANALTHPWESVVSAHDLDYIMGNPPFLGSRMMSPVQKKELREVAVGVPQAGFLDYVTGWYFLASRMMDTNPSIETAFVSTNSISQGEQPGLVWPRLFEAGNHISFAHRTFRWTNAARGQASVHCVIIGFGRRPKSSRELYEYTDIGGEPVLRIVQSISPYLTSGGEHVVTTRQEQISGEARMSFGNMPADGGYLLLSESDRAEILKAEPQAERWILPCLGAREFLQRTPRYCLWLVDATPADLRSMPRVYARVAKVQQVRKSSARPELAARPHEFAQITQVPSSSFLLVPRASSENRDYVPMGFFEPGTVCTDACLAIEGADEFLFGVLTSRIHMDWLRLVGGRLKNDYRYSKDIVYNNFVFPDANPEEREQVASLGRSILRVRDEYPDSSLADLYDPVAMPAALRLVHNDLDEKVESLYRPSGFDSADDRTALLLDLHRRLVM